jgi:F-type H+-transporting ATPase subunit gamma
MKTLASTYLRRAEEQLESVRLYHGAVTGSLRSLLREAAGGPAAAGAAGGAAKGTVGVVLFSTEQGLCGRFNEVLLDETRTRLAAFPGARLMVLGHRGQGLAEAEGLPVAFSAASPTSPDGIDRVMRAAAEDLYAAHTREGIEVLYFLYAVHEAVGRFEVRFDRVLPLDPEQLAGEGEPAGADGRRTVPAPPATDMPRDAFLGGLVEEYYYIQLYRAFVETVAAENSMRLHSMEAAKGNIDDTLEQLEGMRRILRQDQITGELLDVISGAEAVSGS